MSLILDGTNGLSDVDGSASTPAIRGTDTNTGIFFPAADTIAFAEGGAEVARFDSSGNLGLGTTTPSTRLDVNSTATEVARVVSTNASNTGEITIRSNGGVGNNTRGRIIGGFEAGGSDFGGFLAFNTTTSSNVNTERMRLDSSGNLLVGTTSSFGHFAVSSIAGSEGTCISLREWGAGRGSAMNLTAHNTSNADVMYFNTSSTNVGKIAITSSATSYVTSSDYRLKENIAPMTDALTKVALLKPCTYTWKTDGSGGQGFIAHELAEVVPDCVSGEKDAVNEDGSIKPQGIDTSFLVATLTAAIQEQQAIITDLKSRIEALEAK
jgi:hypothetical protein